VRRFVERLDEENRLVEGGTMALRPGDRRNFDTLRRAFANGDVALLECVDPGGNYVAVICAVDYTNEEDKYVMTPFARLFDGDPYDAVTPASGVEHIPAEADTDENTS